MQYPQPKYNGDPTIASLANGLGTLGRYGDSYMVHAAEGETVIPAEILDANPELKNQLFWQMRMMGIEDPNRYVVGNNLNSINPITGQPEFFFKKIFKAIKKVFKKALPVIAPIVGNLILPGIGGPIASGLVTKLQGGSWGDVLKSAAFSYAGSALGQGVMGALQPGAAGGVSGFSEGLGKGIMAPFQAAGNLFSGTGIPLIGGGPAAANPLAQGILGQGGPLGAGGFFPSTAGAPTTYNYGRSGLFPKYNPVTNIPIPPPYQAGYGGKQLQTQTPWKQQAPKGLFSGTAGPSGTDLTGGQMYQVGGQEPVRQVRTSTGEPKWIPESQYEALRSQGAITSDNLLTAQGEQFYTQYDARLAGAPQQGQTQPSAGHTWKADDGQTYQINPLDGSVVKLEEEAASIFSKEGAKQFAGQAAKTLAIPAALGIAAYVMSPEEEERKQQLYTSGNQDLVNKYEEWLLEENKESPKARALYAQWYGTPSYAPQRLATIAGISLEDAEEQPQFTHGLQPSLTAAQGGIMRLQGGGEITGPGTGTSDSIPARLSDGEFVMTADAVRGIGNGNRDLGAARMYDLMSRYERTA